MDDRGTVRVALSVDAVEPRLTGIGRYSLELARGLARHPDIDALRFFRGYDPVADVESLLEPDAPAGRSRLKRWWDRRRNASTLEKMRHSIIHSPNFFLPDWAEGGVATIHDLSVLRYPETHPRARIDDFERRFESTLARVDRIITGTRSMRAEIVETLGLQSDKITVVSHGVGGPPRIDDHLLVSILSEVGLSPGAYSLCVATIEPRKRIAELLDAYSALPARDRDRYPLVIVGKDGWLSDAIIERIDQARAAGWARWLGFASASQLDALYAGAHLFIYPSRYEGFGLPPVEAMARDVPVIISDDPSLVEVSGRAAMVVDADDPAKFANAIGNGLHNGAWRKQAISRGREVVDALSWKHTVARTIDVYRSVQNH